MDVGGRVKLPLLLTPLTYIHVGDAGAVTERALRTQSKNRIAGHAVRTISPGNSP